MSDPSLVRFRAVIDAALAHLEAHRQAVNDLNVFPVADGDTGDNMVLTLRAVLDELDRLSARGPIDAIGREEIVDSVARAALLGARGNSGVILSQLIRGAAEELISRPGELVDPVLVSAAMASAAERAYGSVREPAEGTILTVVREMAHRLASEVGQLDQPRLAQDDQDRQDELLAVLLERALEAGEDSVRRGPDLLPVLKRSGVVDAGGFGVLVMIAGVIAELRGTHAAELAPELARAAVPPVSRPEHESSTFRYCTNFVVSGVGLDDLRLVGALEALGDSVLVVGDHATVKVHLHTDEPERATAVFDGAGAVSHLDVADMREQVAAHGARRAAAPNGRGHAMAATAQAVCGVLAVATGEGVAELFRSLGAMVLDGGATFNPSTAELLAGIHEVPAEEVVVLPNSGNVIMAAERAAELSDKRVVVVGSRSMQAGLAAAVSLDSARGARANAEAMRADVERVRTGAVTAAARDDGAQRFRRGETVGFVGGELVAWGEPAATLRSVIAALSDGAELVTCLSGHDAPLDADAVEALAPSGIELECEWGGQPAYWYLLAAE